MKVMEGPSESDVFLCSAPPRSVRRVPSPALIRNLTALLTSSIMDRVRFSNCKVGGL